MSLRHCGSEPSQSVLVYHSLSLMECVFCGALNIPLDTSGDSEPPAERFQAYDDLNMYESDDVFTLEKEVRTVGGHRSSKDNLEDTNGDTEEEQDELGSDSTTFDNGEFI